MPTIFTHAVCASAIGYLYPERGLPPRFWVLTAACSMLPDADVIGFAFGIRYGDVFGHRGFTHSILFAAIVGVAVAGLFFRDVPRKLSTTALAFYFFGVTLSHPLLDALTGGGLGVALLAPISGERFFFGRRPIAVSPIGIGFFSSRGLIVLASEVVWVWLPSALVVLLMWLYRRMTKHRLES